MARRIKKPAVKPEIRRQWLRRYEEEGQSPPQIAKDDHYDVRTVRKHIEIERQESERREARSIVLRRALEQHYVDLCAFAQKLDSQLTGETSTVALLREDRMWSALQQHIPRSVLWKNLGRREHLQNQLTQAEHDLTKLIREQITTRSKLRITTSPQETGFSERAIDAIRTNAYLKAQGRQELLSFASFELKPDGEGLTIIELGSFLIGKFFSTQVPEIQDLISTLLREVSTWQKCDDISRLLAEFDRVNRILRDELAIITLRRVVPGRCKYCPI